MGNQVVAGDVQERVVRVVKDVLAIDGDGISLDAAITDELATDSLDQVTLFMALEDEFDATIPEEEIEQLKTIRNVVDYIAQRMDAASQG